MLYGSNSLHHSMLRGILKTSILFFERNPNGRILNHSSKDQQVLDELLSLTLLVLLTLDSLAIIRLANPWILIILIILISAFLWFHQLYLIQTSRQLKFLENISQSPIYALFSSSLDWLTSTSAFDIEDDMLDVFLERTDTNTWSFFTLLFAVRWFGLRLDLMTSSFALITVLLSVLLCDRIDPWTVALALSYCIVLVHLFFNGLYNKSTEVEILMIDVEWTATTWTWSSYDMVLISLDSHSMIYVLISVSFHRYLSDSVKRVDTTLILSNNILKKNV